MKNQNFETLCERLGIKAERTEVKKNNNVVMVGYQLGEKNIRPTIYEDMIKTHNEIEMVKILDKILAGIKDTDYIFTKDNAKLTIMFGARNKEMNKEDDSTITFEIEGFPDLEGYFYLKLTESDCTSLGIVNRTEDGCANVVIRKGLQKVINMTIDEMKEWAEVNTYNEFTLKTLSEELREIMNENGDELFPWDNEEVERTDEFFWVASVLNKEKGAGIVASKMCMNAIKELAKKKKWETYAILPSSVHEVLITKLKSIEERFIYDEMVDEVNETQVEKIDQLSNHAYIFTNKE